MAALACQCHPAGSTVHQTADTQTGTRADDSFRRKFDGLLPADLYQVFLIGFCYRQSLGGKVVQQNQRFKTQSLAGGFDGECPVVVGHLHPVAQNRIGNRKGGVQNFRTACAFQISFGGIDNGVVILARQDFSLFNDLWCSFKCKTGIRTADIGNQTRISFSVHSRHGS